MFTFAQVEAMLKDELEAEQRVAEAKNDETVEKLTVARCQLQLERLETLAAASAYLAGKIDGKNEKQREVQLADLLDEDTEIRKTKLQLEVMQDCLVICQHNVAMAEAELHYRQHLSLVAAELVSDEG